jgi:hypothetical protein
MANNFKDVPGVKFIAGRTFKSEYGTHEAGSEVKEALEFRNIEVLVSNHFLYPYAPDEGYDQLPAHLFNHVQKRQEVEGAMTGDVTPKRTVVRPRQMEQSLLEAERQVEIRENLKKTPKEVADALKAKEEAAKEAPVKKAAAKKTTTKKTTAKKVTSNG